MNKNNKTGTEYKSQMKRNIPVWHTTDTHKIAHVNRKRNGNINIINKKSNTQAQTKIMEFILIYFILFYLILLFFWQLYLFANM